MMVVGLKLMLFTALCAVLQLIQASSHATEKCYHKSLPDFPPSGDNRTIPWGQPSMRLSNGSTCCSSLDQVRAGIDDIDAQLLALLSQRAAYVREATRFKATLDTVDVPSRDQEVIQGAEANATRYHLPQTIAREVFTAIINASVPFEDCVFNAFDE
ncbi:chorismate mutase [Hygrophoropsis aurantiaca]|uniref:Chorismate mutase n=1 Tax=Hygrophoropsis aurantiaca TaxID=72124 RepID=A0ACB8AFM1_9AGAM|nr:chorismate mutase [Hygrophoropsis aurantiaca]